MTNIKIKGEEAFKADYVLFIQQLNAFRSKFQSFKEDLEAKREWVDERSVKWHGVVENEVFNAHLYNVEDFIEKVQDGIDSLTQEYPLDNE